jgi:KDO2-lipid IV(A) lauroyltransferase
MRHIKYFLQFLFISFLLILFMIVGLKFSRIIASKLFSTFGPFFRSKKIIEQNISFAFNESDKEFKKSYY